MTVQHTGAHNSDQRVAKILKACESLADLTNELVVRKTRWNIIPRGSREKIIKLGRDGVICLKQKNLGKGK